MIWVRRWWKRRHDEYGGDISEGMVHAGTADGTIVGAVMQALGMLWHRVWRER